MIPRRHVAMLLLAGGMATACGGSRSGAALYARSCAKCHGAAGVPAEAALKMGTPSLADGEWQRERTDAEIRRMITNGSGRGGLMPAFADLSAADLDGLVAYLRSLGPKP